MPNVDQEVYFTRSAPFDVESGQLIFCDVVDSSITSRSSVLSCLAESGGTAKLPASVKVSEFRTWLAAVAESKEQFLLRSFAVMCTVIKVADAVDDKHLDGWVRTAAQVLRHHARSKFSQDIQRSAIEGLSLMAGPLQQRLFAAAAADPQHIDSMVTFLPDRFQPTVLSACTTPDKTLKMPMTASSLLTLTALASLAASPPSVLSLHIADCQQSGHKQNRQQQPEISAGLVNALHHHTGLTTLRLQSSQISATAQQLLPAVATLTSLQLLDFSLCSINTGTLPLLKQTLQALPHLAHLKLTVLEEDVNSGYWNRGLRGTDPDETLPPQGCLADMLSPATALTSLHLGLRTCRPCRSQLASFTALQCLRLPQLVHLNVTFMMQDNIHLAAAFLANLEAPLTSVQLYDGGRFPPGVEPEAAPAAGQLLRSLAAFPTLRSLSAALPTDKTNHSAVFDTVTAALPDLLPAFRGLQSLLLAAEPAVTHRLVPQLAAAAPGLTHLRLGSCEPRIRSDCVNPHRRACAGEWPAFFGALCQLPLQSLDLDWEAQPPPQHGAAALAPLTQLTLLRVRGWICLVRPADWQALARMTRLQHLGLEHADEFQLPRGCVAAMAALSCLTSLTLDTSQDDEQLVSILRACLSPPALPALRALSVALFDPFENADALASYARTLPALRHLTVHVAPSSYTYDEDQAYDSDGMEIDGPKDRIVERARRASEDLKRALAKSHVKLRIVRDELEHV